MDEELRQQAIDEEHLRLLSLGYRVSAGVASLFGLMGLIYVFMGLLFLFAPTSADSFAEVEADVAAMWVFVFFGLIVLLFGLVVAAMRWITGSRLKKRESLLFCQAIAGLTCLETPYGTALGVATLVVLSRPSVKALFEGARA